MSVHSGFTCTNLTLILSTKTILPLQRWFRHIFHRSYAIAGNVLSMCALTLSHTNKVFLVCVCKFVKCSHMSKIVWVLMHKHFYMSKMLWMYKYKNSHRIKPGCIWTVLYEQNVLGVCRNTFTWETSQNLLLNILLIKSSFWGYTCITIIFIRSYTVKLA